MVGESFLETFNLSEAYELRKLLSGWINTMEKHEFLHKVHHHNKGWGQEDTKHE